MERVGDLRSTLPARVSGTVDERDGVVQWSIANDGNEPVAVDRVHLVTSWRTRGRVRVYCHGFQSWTATGVRELGADEDPSRAAGSLELVRGIHNADATVAPAGELRSELVTVLADDAGAVCLGFDGGAGHDGAFRVTREADGTVRVVIEAYLGGVTLPPRSQRAMHAVRVEHGEPGALLERWADWAGTAGGARTGAPYQVGWCSWYQYFHRVTERDLRDNLALASDWPVDVFQLDDGYQAAIGDWLGRNDAFPSPLEHLASAVAGAGFVPGIWIAPFLAAPGSELARAHPDWFAQYRPGRPLVGNVNPAWGGPVWTLDTTHPAALEHLEGLARTLVAMGWRYLKLDFTYAPALAAAVPRHDASRTPAQRVRVGYDAIRRGAGDDVFILGCGAPLGACIGVVDGMRIGPDVAPSWTVPDAAWHPAGYEDCEPAAKNAMRNTLTRAYQHRRLWLNDPDCLMLRTTDTALTEPQLRTWAGAVAASGGMALVSDDLARLDSGARSLLEDVVAIGRAVDDDARAGASPRCLDLFDSWTPGALVGRTARLDADAERGTSQAPLS